MAPGFQPLDEFSYHRCLSHQAGVALVLFSSPGCGACRQVEAMLPRAAPPEAALFRVDAGLSPGLAREFAVFHLPALFLYQDGRYHARLDCQVTPTALGQALARALAAPAEEEP